MREAWAVLRQDRALLVFPILSGFCSLLAMASFVVPFFLTLPWDRMDREGGARAGNPGFGPWHYGLFFLFYLVTYFIVVFFNSGLVACVRMRFAGQKPTVHDGLAFSIANIGRIFQWALLSATVGMLLKTIEDRLGWVGRLIMRLIGLAWTLATTFVVPVLVHEQVGPIEAVKRSAAAFRRTWGEAVIANAGLGAAFMLLFLPALIVTMVAACFLAALGSTLGLVLSIGVTVLCIVYALALVVVQSALQGIFLTACYQYATTGEVPSAFSREYIVEAWRPKQRRWGRKRAD